jgi:glycosyltransferase involved in cell wall biosynthesis
MRVCLNMIVKNESAVIRRCLDSVKGLIDYWVIADTGSSDGTEEIVKETLQDIPGELYLRPWVDFAQNRNEVLSYSKGKGDFVLFIDADERLILSPTFKLPVLNKDHYFIQVMQPDGSSYHRVFLIKNSLPWQWKGVLHEEILSAEAKSVGVIEGAVNYSVAEEGNRAKDPMKFLKDAAVLEKALEKEPDNTRYLFYLALSYGNALDFEKALKYHEKRASLGGDEEEIFFSLFCLANAQENLGYPSDTVAESYIKAYRYRPSRAEPLYALAYLYSRTGNALFAYLLSQFALSIPEPQESHFVLHYVYDYALLLQFADASLALGRIQEARKAYEQLKTIPLPPDKKTWVEKKLEEIG